MTALTYSIRSYVLRQGRITRSQQRAIEALQAQFCIPYEQKTIDWKTIFQQGELIVEIGFGSGEITAQMALEHSHLNFIGVEVFTPGVGSLLKSIQENQLNNIRIIQHDAVEVFQYCLADNSIDGVHIFFPDPWPKKRHHKRRLIQQPFIHLLCQKIRLQGYLHIATDWQNYAEWIHHILSTEPTLTDISHQKIVRPLSKFEQKGLQKGHQIWDFIFKKKG